MNPKISVLIPVYNVEKYISKCAKSLFCNTIASSCEFIFTNDCSTDSSIKELQNVISDFPQLNSNIKILNHERNYGLGKTRNTGFEQATGDYIICVDSDDWVELDYLEELLKCAEINNADVVGCDTYFEYEENHKIEIKKYPLSKNGRQVLFDLFDRKVGGYLWIKLFKRKFLINNNIRWENDVSLWEDVLFDTKVFINNPVINYISKPLYHYLIRKGSYLHTLHSTKTGENFFLAVSYIKSILDNYNDKELLEKFLERSYILKYQMISQGNKNSQKTYLNLYPELNKYMNKSNTKPFYQLIFRINNKHKSFAKFILVFYSYIKALLGRISLKEYLSNN